MNSEHLDTRAHQLEQIPGGIRTVEEKETLKKHLKTALFSRQDS